MITKVSNKLRDERGAAVIELALVAPVLALMTVGIVDMSNAFSRKLQLEQAAQRSIEKIMQTTGNLTVEDTIKQEAVCQVNGTNTDGSCKTGTLTAADVTVTFRLECDAVVVANYDSKCTGTQKEARYISVQVSSSYEPMFPIHFSGIGTDGKYKIEAIAGMRIAST